MDDGFENLVFLTLELFWCLVIFVFPALLLTTLIYMIKYTRAKLGNKPKASQYDLID